MFALRRYVPYVGIAVFILLTFGYFRGAIVRQTQSIYNDKPSIPERAHHKLPPGNTPQHMNGEPFRWEDVPTQFPVVNFAPLPVATPSTLPKVQYDFPRETESQAAKRKKRQAAVRSTFERCWKSYKQHAWMRDELAPISGDYKNGFGGWAATLVDSLDLLWIMGLKSEFEEAVVAVAELNLSSTTLGLVNVFETTIRHLGGLLSAYDLSGDERLLEKATEFGAMLYKAFDTPNRMPITRWSPGVALMEFQQAPGGILVAEIGSLSMEFTRLSQVTGDPKWYDAVDRITRVFDKQQYRTFLPGMWPVVVDAFNMEFNKDKLFTLSAMSDSLYEYFPKMHALLGGVDPVYRKLYEGSMKTAIKHNLWRPMAPGDPDILMSGNVRTDKNKPPELETQGQHLVCFAGGMFALGGKLFSNPAHVEIGKKLTDGCIWSYKAFPSGIMPEVFTMTACKSRTDCKWDEQVWLRELAARPNANKQVLDDYITGARLPKGFTGIPDRRYILRPEAIESVFILYRITGEEYLLDAAWDMFTAITSATETALANAALSDVTVKPEQLGSEYAPRIDSMESFWMAETLKYFFLIFSEPDVISLDEWVFNTEAHPFRRRLPG